jgi:hypothetical protein
MFSRMCYGGVNIKGVCVKFFFHNLVILIISHIRKILHVSIIADGGHSEAAEATHKEEHEQMVIDVDTKKQSKIPRGVRGSTWKKLGDKLLCDA